MLIGALLWLAATAVLLLLVGAVRGTFTEVLGDPLGTFVPAEDARAAFVPSALSLAAWAPALLLARRIVPILPSGFLFSVSGRLRLPLLGRWIGPALGIGAVTLTVSRALDAFTGAPPALQHVSPDAIWYVLLAVLLVPVAVFGEELLLRAAVPQLLGAAFRSPWVAYGVPALLVAAVHAEEGWGMVRAAVLAVAAGWLTWRTGGVEAAVALGVAHHGLALIGRELVPVGGVTLAGGTPFAVLLAAGVIAFVEIDRRRGGVAQGLVNPAPLVRRAY